MIAKLDIDSTGRRTEPPSVSDSRAGSASYAAPVDPKAPLFPPDAASVREVDRRLKAEYGSSSLGNKQDPLDELIFIILSGKTQEANYFVTFDALKARYGTWDEAAKASAEEIEDIIRSGGLARKKSEAISTILRTIIERLGAADLSLLHELDDAAAYDFLRTLPGVGPKTARCVLSYSLDRGAFAVDAHVSRIMKRLGWSRHHRLTDRVHERLQDMVPPDIRTSLHVNLVVHGREVCTKRNPTCSRCAISSLCPSAGKVDPTAPTSR